MFPSFLFLWQKTDVSFHSLSSFPRLLFPCLTLRRNVDISNHRWPLNGNYNCTKAVLNIFLIFLRCVLSAATSTTSITPSHIYPHSLIHVFWRVCYFLINSWRTESVPRSLRWHSKCCPITLILSVSSDFHNIVKSLFAYVCPHNDVSFPKSFAKPVWRRTK